MKLYLLIITIFLSGCSGYTHTIKERELTNYKGESHESINVLLSMDTYFDTTLYNPLEHIYSNLVQSKRFYSVSSGKVGAPYVVEIKFSSKDDSSASEIAGSILSAATLFIVPHNVTRTYQIEVKLFDEKSLIFQHTYSDTMKGANSVANLPIDGIKDSVDLLVFELLHDIENNKLIPLVKKT